MARLGPSPNPAPLLVGESSCRDRCGVKPPRCPEGVGHRTMDKKRYYVAVHRPNGFNHSASLDATARRDIDELNADMEAAGVRVFVGGLRPPAEAGFVQWSPDGTLARCDGACPTGESYVDGFWILGCQDIDEALGWGRRAATACRASVEVRPFHG